jgi:hypothetical protein
LPADRCDRAGLHSPYSIGGRAWRRCRARRHTAGPGKLRPGISGGGGDPASTRNVANRLQISIKRVQAYCARIKDKLNLANATELLREAIRWTERNAF